jgi:hypothetical protein
MNSTTKLPAKMQPNPLSLEAVLKDGLPRSCNVYIPKQLRDQLDWRAEQKGEMRRKIAICFVEISALKMTEEELVKKVCPIYSTLGSILNWFGYVGNPSFLTFCTRLNLAKPFVDDSVVCTVEAVRFTVLIF